MTTPRMFSPNKTSAQSSDDSELKSYFSDKALEHGASGKTTIHCSEPRIDASEVVALFEEMIRNNPKHSSYLDQDGKLKKELEEWILTKVKSARSDEARRHDYGATLYVDKVYNPKVTEETNKVIDFLKNYVKENSFLQGYLDSKGEVKKEDRIWLQERMEGWLSSDKHKQPAFSNFYIYFVFEMAVRELNIAPHQEFERSISEYENRKCRM